MLQPLKLGNKTFPVNIIQGPLAGVSCAPFRRLVWRYSQPAFACTEMISCKTLIHQPALAHQRYMAKDPAEGPVCFQLSGNDPVELAQAVRIATENGADLIDLNCGCPVKKIRSKGAGSSLLTNASQLSTLIKAMKDNTHVPVSVKIRVESEKEKFNRDVASAVSDAGADFLIVHGRHWSEHYETVCRYDDIEFFVSEMKIPVIGNGDIACIDSLKKMFATGCAGVMLARSGVGQPWLIGKLIAEVRNEVFQMPDLDKIGEIFFEHVSALAKLLNSEKFAVIQARKFAKYYARNMPWKDEFVSEVNNCQSLMALKLLVDMYFLKTSH